MTLEAVLGWWSGLAFVAPPLPLGTLVGTMLAMHVCDAIMCRLLATNGGYPRNAWTVIGFVGGIWALAVLLVLPRRDGTPRVKDRLP